MMQTALCYKLVELGHSVSITSNGQEAIELIGNNRKVDLVICDVMMPVLTGPSVILMLKNYFRQQLPFIVVISGVKEGEAFLRKLEIGYDHFLPKPVDFDHLATLVNELQERKNSTLQARNGI